MASSSFDFSWNPPFPAFLPKRTTLGSPAKRHRNHVGGLQKLVCSPRLVRPSPLSLASQSTYRDISLLLTISVHTHSDDADSVPAQAAETAAPAVQAPPNQKKPVTSTRRGGGYYNRGGKPQAPVTTPGAQESPVDEKKCMFHGLSITPFAYPH